MVLQCGLIARDLAMNETDTPSVIRKGCWFYGGLTACPVHIVRHHTLYGSHDPEDPVELAMDREVECFYIRYRPPGPHENWHHGGVALSLREAVFMAQRKLGPVLQWEV